MIPIQCQIENYLTHVQYELKPINMLSSTPDRIEQLVRICNEPPIYSILFEKKLKGEPYSAEQAQGFFEWGNKGWREGAYFCFVVESPAGEIAAAIDIKSSHKEFAEAGYWSSSKHRGIMSNTLAALVMAAGTAGYQTLFARVRKSNLASIKVLTNNQFIRDDAWMEEPTYFCYLRNLAL